MKTIIFAVVFALIGINAAVAADNKNTNIIPTPNQLVETDLLPQFKAKVKMEAKGWYGKCGSEGKLEFCSKENNASDKPTA